jgi:hypothetical protein
MKSLIFIYNAKSDGINKAFDFAHKIISTKTYSCDLCSLTHGNFGERKEWTELLKTSELDIIFYHKDEFDKVFKTQFKYPVILEKNNNDFNEFISSNEISTIDSIEELIRLITIKM